LYTLNPASLPRVDDTALLVDSVVDLADDDCINFEDHAHFDAMFDIKIDTFDDALDLLPLLSFKYFIHGIVRPTTTIKDRMVEIPNKIMLV